MTPKYYSKIIKSDSFQQMKKAIYEVFKHFVIYD